MSKHMIWINLAVVFIIFIFKRCSKVDSSKSVLQIEAFKYSQFYNWIINTMAEPSAAAPATQQLNLKVKSQDGEEVFFKIKSSTQLKKLMDAYCQRQSLNSSNVRFLFDGERLHETQTPKDLNMENGDQIDVVIEQVGGR